MKKEQSSILTPNNKLVGVEPTKEEPKLQPVHPVKQKKGLNPKSKPNKKKKENSGQRKKRN